VFVAHCATPAAFNLPVQSKYLMETGMERICGFQAVFRGFRAALFVRLGFACLDGGGICSERRKARSNRFAVSSALY